MQNVREYIVFEYGDFQYRTNSSTDKSALSFDGYSKLKHNISRVANCPERILVGKYYIEKTTTDCYENRRKVN